MNATATAADGPLTVLCVAVAVVVDDDALERSRFSLLCGPFFLWLVDDSGKTAANDTFRGERQKN